MGIRGLARALSIVAIAAVGCSSSAEPAPDPVAPTPADPAPAEPEVAPLEKPDTEPSPGKMPPGEAVPPDGMQTVLAEHNRYRAKHCAPPLVWSPDIARVAQSWAETLRDRNCAFEHSRTKYGENLAGGSASMLTPERVAAMWYEEIADYDWKSPGFSMETGHFTQVVWADSKRLGCGVATCQNGMSIWVCNYEPAGNMQGAYRPNVKPTSCK